MIVPIDDILDICRYGRHGTIRPANDDEDETFIQKRDKMCTGMIGRTSLGVTFSFDCDPPVMLRSGGRYVIELE